MTWVRLDDTWVESEAALEAGPLACWLHVCALSYSNRALSDGRLPRAVVRRLADTLDEDPLDLAAQLVDAGLWAETSTGFEIVDQSAEWQPTRAQVEAARDKKTARQARWRAKRVDDAPVDASTPASVDASRDAPVEGAPTRPDPTRPEGAGVGTGKGTHSAEIVTRLRKLRRTWTASDVETGLVRLRDLLSPDYGDVDSDAEHFLVALATRSKPIEHDLGVWLSEHTDAEILANALMPAHRHPSAIDATDRARRLDEHDQGEHYRARARGVLGPTATAAHVDREAEQQLAEDTSHPLKVAV